MTEGKNECRCWSDSPNESYKRYDREGNLKSWKCVDEFEFVRKTRKGKTVCTRKMQTERGE